MANAGTHRLSMANTIPAFSCHHNTGVTHFQNWSAVFTCGRMIHKNWLGQWHNSITTATSLA